jgi:toxin secretion/phage lysis holin
LESRAGFKGLCRKGMALLIVLIGARLDMTIGSNIIRDACVVGIITNELISIIENAGLMGVPVPAILVNSIEILKKKSEPTNTDAERDDSNVGQNRSCKY